MIVSVAERLQFLRGLLMHPYAHPDPAAWLIDAHLHPFAPRSD